MIYTLPYLSFYENLAFFPVWFSLCGFFKSFFSHFVLWPELHKSALKKVKMNCFLEEEEDHHLNLLMTKRDQNLIISAWCLEVVP